MLSSVFLDDRCGYTFLDKSTVGITCWGQHLAPGGGGGGVNILMLIFEVGTWMWCADGKVGTGVWVICH